MDEITLYTIQKNMSYNCGVNIDDIAKKNYLWTFTRGMN